MKKLSYKEQREFSDLERKIAELEKQSADQVVLQSSGAGSYADHQLWAEQQKSIAIDIEKATSRWMELAERKQ